MRAALCLMILAGPVPASAQDLPAEGPRLSAASNLSQGGQARLLASLRMLGVTDLRDGMNWAQVETRRGVYDFSSPRVSYPDDLIASDIRVSATINWGNPLYENGATPVTAAGRAALRAFSTALVDRFPGLDSIEVGNEFNGTNFVKGPMKSMDPIRRAKAYVPFLAAVAQGAQASRPDIRISGGATHSMAAGYLWAVLDAGGARYLDALAIHPYTTPAEQLVRQVGVLRRHPDAAGLPLEMTEFGTPDPAAAASHLLRNYCQMALSGVSRAAWYPLKDRGDGLVPLLGQDGQVTPAGLAYGVIAERMEGRPVTDATPDDPATYGCLFGSDVLVLWGAPRAVRTVPGLLVLHPDGTPAAAPLTIGPDAPLIVIDQTGGDVRAGVDMDDHGIIADSFHHYAYPLADELVADGDAFARFVRRGGQILPLTTRPGQERSGTPWFPYRAPEGIQQARLTAESLVPAGTARRPVEIVHVYTATEAIDAMLTARFAPGKDSEDGITVTLRLNGRDMAAQTGKGPIRLDRAIRLAAGDALEIAVGPGGNPRGDITDYRITLSRP